MAGKKRTRKPLTPEQKAELDQRRREITERSRTALADPRLSEQVLRVLNQGSGDTLGRFSLGNVALMLDQAAEQGFDLTEVDTYRGWLARGRQVREGVTGLRILEPVSKKTDDDTEAKGDKARKTLMFCKVGTRFDISQTDPIEGFEAPADAPAAPGRDQRAAAMLDKIADQMTKAGYTLLEAPAHDGPTTDVDPETSTVVVYGDKTGDKELTALVATLAAILATQDGDGEGASVPRPRRATEAKPAPAAPEPEPVLTF